MELELRKGRSHSIKFKLPQIHQQIIRLYEKQSDEQRLLIFAPLRQASLCQEGFPEGLLKLAEDVPSACSISLPKSCAYP